MILGINCPLDANFKLLSVVPDIKMEVLGLKPEVPDIQMEALGLKSEVPDIKMEALGLKSEVPDIQMEALDLKTEEAEVKTEGQDIHLEVQATKMKALIGARLFGMRGTSWSPFLPAEEMTRTLLPWLGDSGTRR